MVCELKNPALAAHLFEGWQETLIWSCLQKVMGHLYADSLVSPVSAMALLGDFCFFAGKPDREFILFKPECCRQDFMIMVPSTDEWGLLIEETYGRKAKRVERYATGKEPGVFDREKLQRAVDELPPQYNLQMIDGELFEVCRKTVWCRDLVAQYETYESYRERGLGAVILENGEIVSGASSYAAYQGGIEIEVDTRESHRRKGLAYAACAKLILSCLERGWYPSWDAQNLWSLTLAEKLGYHFAYTYAAYEIEVY